MARAGSWDMLLGIGSLLATFAIGDEISEKAYFEVNIHNIADKDLASLKARSDITWWIEADDQLLVLANSGFDLPATPVHRLDLKPQVDRLFVVQKGHRHDLDKLNGDILSQAGRMALIQARETLPNIGVMGDIQVLGFQPNTVFVRHSCHAPMTASTGQDAAVEKMVKALDGERWRSDVETLTSFNRYSHDLGLQKARDWLVGRFQENSGVTAQTQEYAKRTFKSWNVVATIEGTERPDELYIFGAHYDSISESPEMGAPGAEDNASGTAGLLELARIFSKHPPKATVIFVAFSGEEQGLWGSQAYVRTLVESGKRDKIKAVITMDMIAFDGNDTLDVLIESSATNKSLVKALGAAAATYTELEFKSTEHYWGSDHVSFIDENIPAVLTIEDDWDDYPDYHRTTDKIENVKTAMGLEILKMNLATMATWTNSK